jgi:predicted nucleotidyltransferase/DNA-binding transcriptional regulator YiaG
MCGLISVEVETQSTIRYTIGAVDLDEPARLAGELLCRARMQAGLTQTELAHRAGIQQSVVSAYESGRRQPTVPMLLRLIRAAGQVLQFQLIDGADRGSATAAPASSPAQAIPPLEPTGGEKGVASTLNRQSASETPLGKRLRRERRAVLDTAARYGASNVRVFGSVARGEDRSDSDVDLLVDLAADRSLFDLVGLRQDLEDLLRAKVDVVPAAGLRPGIREQVGSEARPL